MSKRGNRQNRVCFDCRIKYPDSGFSTPDKFNMTSVCSECKGELCNIHDSVHIPAKSKIKLWKKLKDDYDNGTIETPTSKYGVERRFLDKNPDQALVYDRLERPIRNRRLRESREENVVPVIGMDVYKNLNIVQKEILAFVMTCNHSCYIRSLYNIAKADKSIVLLNIKDLEKQNFIYTDGDQVKTCKHLLS
jgi:hypothetical protein